MSKFPSPEIFSVKQSSQHLSKLPSNSASFILKKAKGVYLYDLDGNKYVDFSLNHGTIFAHSPSRLTHFVKNALSSGMNSMGFYSKFMLKAQQNWKSCLNCKEISFYSSFIQMLLAVITKYSIKKIAYTSDYLYLLMASLGELVEFYKINELTKAYTCDLLLFEEYNDEFSTLTYQSINIPAIKIHNRFVYRRKNPVDFKENCMHYIDTIPFGGKSIGILFGDENIPYISPPFDEGILFLEGSKIFNKNVHYPVFFHEKFTNYLGFSISQEILDKQFFLERGIYCENNILYFSPFHTEHDMKRLKKALIEYFIPK